MFGPDDGGTARSTSSYKGLAGALETDAKPKKFHCAFSQSRNNYILYSFKFNTTIKQTTPTTHLSFFVCRPPVRELVSPQ